MTPSRQLFSPQPSRCHVIQGSHINAVSRKSRGVPLGERMESIWREQYCNDAAFPVASSWLWWLPLSKAWTFAVSGDVMGQSVDWRRPPPRGSHKTTLVIEFPLHHNSPQS